MEQLAPLEQLLIGLLLQWPWLLFKMVVIVLLVLHLFFSFILMRQTKLMIHVVEANISPFIYQIAVIHLLASLFVFIWTILFF